MTEEQMPMQAADGGIAVFKSIPDMRIGRFEEV